MGDSVFWSIEVIAPTAQFIELDSDDLPRSFLLDRGIDPPDPALPLSQLGLFFGIEFAAGEREKTVTIPIDRDGISEPLEGVMLRLDGFGDPVVPRPIELKGLVPAN
jgi:hypothetical protein